MTNYEIEYLKGHIKICFDAIEIDNLNKECVSLKKVENLALIAKLSREAYDLENWRLNNK